MSTPDSKEPPTPPEGLREVVASGTAQGGAGWHRDGSNPKVSTEPWYRTVTRCAKKIRGQFSGDPDPETAERIQRVFRAALRPRRQPGQKPNPDTVRAAQIYLDGMRLWESSGRRPAFRRHQRQLWQRIYREVLSGFPAMDKYERFVRTSALRRNVKAYLLRLGVKWSEGIRVTTRKPPRKRAIAADSQTTPQFGHAAEDQDPRSDPGHAGEGCQIPA
jgi:hypothetical protein